MKIKKSLIYLIPIFIFSLIFLNISINDVEAILFQIDLNDSMDANADNVSKNKISIKITDLIISEGDIIHKNTVKKINDHITSNNNLDFVIRRGDPSTSDSGDSGSSNRDRIIVMEANSYGALMDAEGPAPVQYADPPSVSFDFLTQKLTARTSLLIGSLGGGGTIGSTGLFLGAGGKIISPDIFQVGEVILLSYDLNSKKGIDDLEHATLYMNMRGDKSIHDSNTYIRFQAFKDLIVKDDSNFFSNVDLKIIKKDSTNYTLEFYMIFDQPMDTSDVHLRIWTFDKRTSDQHFKNSIKVIPEKIEEDSTPSLQDEEFDIPSIDNDLLMGWAGLNEKSVSDDELLNHLEIEGENIPSWVKKSKIVKWLSEGLISEEDFLKIIQFLYSEGYIV